MNPLTTWAALLAAAPKRTCAFLPPRYAALLLGVLALCVPARALASKNGIATESCGCHNGGSKPSVMITPNLTTLNPGQMLTLTVSVATINGNPGVAGFYLEASTGGTFKILDSGTKLNGNGVTHSSPRAGVGGFATFQVGWTAPATPGGVDFAVFANSGNGDGSTRGDAEGTALFSIAYGCTGTKYYRDFDGDGVGAELNGSTLNCTAPMYYTAKSGDCNDNDPAIFPGAKEVCDGKDNNCDGQVDEGFTFTALCPDADGDGHGVAGKPTMMACGPGKGWGLCDNDCNDNDATIHPGAVELCNNKDDNCNGTVDEGARTVCGVGWCARYADSCGQSCTPGLPRAEECDDFDDDCDGVKDNGTDLQLCKASGLVCRGGSCIPGNSTGGTAGTSAGGNPGLGGGLSTGGAAGSNGTAGAAGTNNEPGCALGSGRTRPPFAALGLLLGAAALVRRKRHRR
ncbi:MAG: MopE-related protein [Pseudomonadota bacterium]